jgi:hypothetical protein
MPSPRMAFCCNPLIIFRAGLYTLARLCASIETSSLSDLSDRHEPSGKTRTDLPDFEAHSGSMQRENGQIWTVSPTGAVDQPQVRQAASSLSDVGDRYKTGGMSRTDVFSVAAHGLVIPYNASVETQLPFIPSGPADQPQAEQADHSLWARDAVLQRPRSVLPPPGQLMLSTARVSFDP